MIRTRFGGHVISVRNGRLDHLNEIHLECLIRWPDTRQVNVGWYPLWELRADNGLTELLQAARPFIREEIP